MSVSQIELIKHYWDEPLIGNQIHVSLGNTPIVDMTADVNRHEYRETGISGLLEYCQMHGLPIQAYSPLDGGRFTKGIDAVREEDRALANRLIHYADKYNTTPNAIALAWVLKLPVKMHPIIGTTNPTRIRESVDALSIALSQVEWYDLWLLARRRPLP